ncbi:hypothetical protein L1987_46250 [Smallanthus sonchifolius]|uniref:Uncharacterized protein n=1 Tax=Smallanthus sonchifolius TaxID=185202 RepID=A0ACB9G075_9ASTR|nr:hypothetical protein L1987_46250 [Smallanthus sonchifolius]
MSDNIPFEIQVEIMKRLPVKSLIQFRSVSKAWKSLIDSSDFIARYSGQQHLLVSYNDLGSFEQKYVSVVEDDTFPQHKVSLITPLLVNWLEYYDTIGCSHGLLCLYNDYLQGRDGPIPGIGMAVLWNLSIRKAVAIVVPNVANGMIYTTVLGFGVCRGTSDPKLVKITQINGRSDMESIDCIPWQVEVFTLSTRAWRNPYSNNLPRKSIEFVDSQVVVDGFHYWLAIDNRTPMDGEYKLIISFDMTSEEFREINLPDSLAQSFMCSLSISKLRESLVVLEQGLVIGSPIVVWMMEDGVPKSFTKLFNVNVNTLGLDDAIVRGFRKCGEPVFEISEDLLGICKLVVYGPYSNHIDNLGIDGIDYSSYVYPYMETLHLLDHPNLTVYNEMKTIKFEDDLFQELNLSRLLI